jgi:hypothetical protein
LGVPTENKPIEQSDAIEVRVPVSYRGIDDLPIHFANAFIAQKTTGQDEFIISFGHISPPVLLGTPEQQREQAAQISYVQAKMIARFGMNAQRVRELVELLTGYLRQLDEGKLK